MKNKKQSKAKQAVGAYRGVSSPKNKNKSSEQIKTDPLGSYTGNTADGGKPSQDGDDI